MLHLRFELIEDARRLAELEPRWWRLWRAAQATPFQSPAWLLPWLEYLGAGQEPCTIAVFAGDELVALLPLARCERRGERHLGPLGVGVSDYLDALLDPRVPDAGSVLAQACAALREHEGNIELPDVPETSPLRELGRALGANEEPGERCPALQLDRSFASYVGELPDFLRRNLRQGRARLQKLGAVDWRATERSNLEQQLEALFHLHAKLWNARGQRGVLADEGVQNFHHRAAARLLEAGLLWLSVLTVDGRAVGALYGFDGLDAHYYLGGFEPELYDCSPGSLLIAHAIEAAIARGKRRFDFLRGDEPYKYSWRASDHHTYRIVLRAERTPLVAAAAP